MKLNIIRTILIILLLGTFYIIFGFSSQTGEDSGKISTKISKFIINIVNKEKINDETTVHAVEVVVRKLAHFSIYMVVGCLLMGLCCTYNLTTKQKFMISVIIGFLYACSDEIHQLFVSERTGKPTDVLIDTSGCFVGTLIIYNIWRIATNKNKRF